MYETKVIKGNRPDYSGKGVAVWLNENDKYIWLTIKIDGQEKKLVAFKNDK